MAIGGFASNLLERTTERDIREFYPDLIIFHVYGDYRAYERIIRLFRSRTAADIIVSTDHIVDPPEPVCASRLHLRWSPPPGCAGHFWFKQHHWEDFMSGYWIPTMAQRYQLAIEPRRARWGAYLESHNLQARALIADAPHPNDAGWHLMADLFTSWFERVIARRPNQPTASWNLVSSLPPPAIRRTSTYRFTGNRIEIVGTGPLNGKVRVSVDGKLAEAVDGCWLDSRVSALPNAPDWPAISQVWVSPEYHRADSWSVRVSNLNGAQDEFDFSLQSRMGGADGRGTARRPFVSPSGRVAIAPIDWNLDKARMLSKKGVPNGTTFTWQRNFICGDQQPIPLPNGHAQQRYLVATGLWNGAHSVQIWISPGAPAMSEVRTYRPPLRS